MNVRILPNVTVPQAMEMASKYGCKLWLCTTGKYLQTETTTTRKPRKRPFIILTQPEPPTAA